MKAVISFQMLESWTAVCGERSTEVVIYSGTEHVLCMHVYCNKQ